jgi:hypothetical protein
MRRSARPHAASTADGSHSRCGRRPAHALAHGTAHRPIALDTARSVAGLAASPTAASAVQKAKEPPRQWLAALRMPSRSAVSAATSSADSASSRAVSRSRLPAVARTAADVHRSWQSSVPWTATVTICGDTGSREHTAPWSVRRRAT